ncbi:MAG TPA: response regulator [Tepidisphaeraceae bacterium]|nr:response regulator [Tepidisphaeraceae bacterium]
MAAVLIIDDDARGTEPLARLLRQEGHEATLVSTVREALSELRSNPPDLVLLDLSLPRVDGLDLLDAMNAEPRLAGLRVAVYSGRDDEQSIRSAKELGAQDFIQKGRGWDHVIERIRANLATVPMA